MEKSSSKDADSFAAKRNAHYNRYYKNRHPMTAWHKERLLAGKRRYQQSVWVIRKGKA